MTYPPQGSPVEEIHNIEFIEDSSDLPNPVGGVHPLKDATVYYFNGFVTSPNGLQLGDPSPLVGSHGGTDGFIHTGAATAITGSNVSFLQRDMYTHAPGGQLLDITGTTDDEVLIESVSYSDAAGLGQIANVGVFDGMRVPSLKGVNIEDFAAGLTFTGSPEKVFIEGCPIRGVTAPNVTALTFDSGFTTDVVDMPNNYAKSLQSDTEVVHVDPSATINEIFQYRGNTHDGTVAESNILTGQAAVDAIGYRVSDSFPLSNSQAYFDYTLDSTTTTTINTQATSKLDADAYERASGTTTLTSAARFSHTDNEATFEGKRDRVASLQASISLSTGTSDVVAVAWFVNGNINTSTANRIAMNQQGGGVAKSLTSAGVQQNIETGDTLDIRVANLGSTTDIEIGELSAKAST